MSLHEMNSTLGCGVVAVVRVYDL